MKWVLVIISIILLLIVGSAILGYFYQKEIVDYFNNLGWSRLANFASGPWWNSLPSGILSISVLTSMWFIFWQIVEARKSTNTRIALDLYKELRSPEAINKLRIIYNATKLRAKLNKKILIFIWTALILLDIW